MKGCRSFQLLLNIKGLSSFLDFVTGWVTITSLGFVFDGPSLNIVILISSIGGVDIKVSNVSDLILHSSLRIILINC